MRRAVAMGFGIGLLLSSSLATGANAAGERFAGRDPALRVGEQDSTLRRHHSVSDRQPSGKESRPAGRANARTDIEVRPFLSLRRHAIEVWRANRWMTETSQIPVTQIVAKDHYKVRLLRRLNDTVGRMGQKHECQSDRYGSAHIYHFISHLSFARSRWLTQ